MPIVCSAEKHEHGEPGDVVLLVGDAKDVIHTDAPALHGGQAVAKVGHSLGFIVLLCLRLVHINFLLGCRIL